MKAILLGIGDELITGQTVDTNSAYLAQQLCRLGIEPIAHWTVADRREDIAAAFRQAGEQADVIIATGGLGPTADDVTRQALADALGVELRLDPGSLSHIEEFFRRRGRAMAECNKIQAMLPATCRPIVNLVGTAPGMAGKLGRADIFVMPGVPSEMKWMFDHGVREHLAGKGGCILHHVIHTFGAGESDVGQRIVDLMSVRSGPLTVGTTVAAGMVSVRITARDKDEPAACREIQRTAEIVRQRLGPLIVGEGDETLPQVVGQLLRRCKCRLATAESCTGGLLGELITGVPGASEYYLGGVVSYSNAAKIDLLGVPENLLSKHGAVSEPVAAAMAEGCRRRFAADYALSVTGIAGPDGGTAEKPVGLVFLAIAGAQGTVVRRQLFPGDRPTVRLRSALSALNELRLTLLGATGE